LIIYFYGSEQIESILDKEQFVITTREGLKIEVSREEWKKLISQSLSKTSLGW
tara:strand:- start:272 stop:430 length:159 start_codon:yes stop_codon:yes gene_type:complete